MARRNSTTIQEELYPASNGPAREELDDARLLDLDAEKESPFLRAQKRVSVRRSPLPKKTAARLLWVVIALAALGATALGAAIFYRYEEHSWRFRLDSSDNIEMAGPKQRDPSASDGSAGRGHRAKHLLYTARPTAKQLQQIPWVASASVMRFAPNRIKIQIHERTPVAFAQVGSKVMLIDAGGVLMDLTNKKRYSFPVVIGMSANEPLSTRSIRMRTFNQLVHELDSGGGHYSQDLSEVDLTDPEDVKVLTNDPAGEVLVHLGSANYLDRFKIYVAHLREWRQQFTKLESVDLRYDQQIIVNPDLRGTARQPALTQAAAKAAIAAGVKPSVLHPSRTPAPSTPHAVLVRPIKKSATSQVAAASPKNGRNTGRSPRRLDPHP